MLTNLWYVVLPSAQLKEGLTPVQLLGQHFVAFRDEGGTARLLSDICVHRGGSLSAGAKVGGDVQCPYHGWRFGGDGVCSHIPAQPDLHIPLRARVDAYPTIERHGWIWAFLGDLPEAERPPLPPLDWVDDPGVRVVSGHFDWDASWDRVMENGLDFAHAPFVHGSTFGDPDHPEIGSFSVEREAWGGSALMTMRRPLRKGWRRQPTGQHVDVATRPGFHLSGPCVTLELAPRDGWKIYIVSAHTPVDGKRTRTWWMMGRTFMRWPLLDRRVVASNLKIFNQDLAVLSKVRPERVPDSWLQEVSVKSDALQIAFRQKIKELEARGWRIDEIRVEREFTGRVACVVPSPERRDGGPWAIETIPIVAR
ncbi:Rieske 2Fe-2S domain-containing protein [Pseudoduganella sp. FT25W]|jgi:phenylpropionate dioxygenase-like ring-hydroxylating dioxygenase large terminal subunit|uniref:Rieske 2Fe-2S domain-containing protein n=1 Tax=Duganella alba TaxID=2666081 RepID=A0A6L5QF09_9BURK|nr:aromatic ring-hydroxylating dioxygenase subunit alpha [Duganella alba]MRX07691.1 Rieske 2Fe-2S domain-containing protein [Duganella alba]MRX19855.1 Rieske 2Fe-2S domain-containing protein [Duganella alba]